MMQNYNRKRTNSSQLPDKNELNKIIAQESKRDLPTSKINSHYPNFITIIQLLKHLGIEDDTFEITSKTHEEIVTLGKRIIDEVVEKLLNQKPSKELIKLLDAIYESLSEEDKLDQSDIIFVFGSKTPLRIEKAIELYKAGFAPKIMISGGAPFYANNTKSEAEEYRDIAIESGVDPNDILVDSKSITIPDNVRTSLNLLDELGIKYQSIILVNSPYVQRRGWVHFMKYIENNQKLVRVNSDTSEKYLKDKWFKSEDGIRVVINEFVKMKIAVSLNTA